eukprot:202706_1
MQILDKIHCFFKHSYDIGYRLTSVQRDAITEVNENTTLSITTILKNSKIQKRYQLLCSNVNKTDKLQFQTRHTKFNQLKPNISNNIYSFGTDFKYDQDTDVEDYLLAMQVSPKYKTLKAELTDNCICKLTMMQFQSEYEKAKIHRASKHCKQTYFGVHRYGVSSRPKEDIPLPMILSLMIYCNYTELQCEFKQHCRPWEKESIADFAKRNAEIAIWCRYLVECCCIYGEKIDEKECLYTGLTCKLLFDSFNSTYFHCPLSTTPDLSVAQRFTTVNGVIIQCNGGNESAMKLDVSWLSDYPTEKERLIVGQSLKITNIITFDDEKDELYSLSEWISSLLLFEKLIDGLFFSFDKTLVSESSQDKLLLLIKEHVNDDNKNLTTKTNNYVQLMFNNMTKKMFNRTDRIWMNESELIRLSNDKLCSYLYDFWEEKCGKLFRFYNITNKTD